MPVTLKSRRDRTEVRCRERHQCRERRLFNAVLLPCILQGLPLHIGRIVSATAFEGDDVIDDIAGARSGGVAVDRARIVALEGTTGGGGGGQGGSQPGGEQDRGQMYKLERPD